MSKLDELEALAKAATPGPWLSATNGNGQRVRGTVCCGYFVKGCTLRW